MTNNWLLISLIVTLVANCHASDVFSEVKSDDFWFRTVVVPPGEIAASAMEVIGEEFLQEAGPRRIVVLWVNESFGRCGPFYRLKIQRPDVVFVVVLML